MICCGCGCGRSDFVWSLRTPGHQAFCQRRHTIAKPLFDMETPRPAGYHPRAFFFGFGCMRLVVWTSRPPYSLVAWCHVPRETRSRGDSHAAWKCADFSLLIGQSCSKGAYCAGVDQGNRRGFLLLEWRATSALAWLYRGVSLSYAPPPVIVSSGKHVCRNNLSASWSSRPGVTRAVIFPGGWMTLHALASQSRRNLVLAAACVLACELDTRILAWRRWVARARPAFLHASRRIRSNDSSVCRRVAAPHSATGAIAGYWILAARTLGETNATTKR